MNKGIISNTLHLCHIALTQITTGVSGSEVSGILKTGSVIKNYPRSAECEQKWLAPFPPLDISNLFQSPAVLCHPLVSDREGLMHQWQKALWRIKIWVRVLKLYAQAWWSIV